jgi:hypothetical protein
MRDHSTAVAKARNIKIEQYAMRQALATFRARNAMA